MKSLKFFLILILLFLLWISCIVERKKKQNINNENLKTKNSTTTVANSSTKNSCTITGTIISIDSVLSDDSGNPCSKSPCKAHVKLIEVKNCGVGFINKIYAGQEISIHFGFTLAPTTPELFPNMNKRYPGLKESDEFSAEVESQMFPGNTFNYVVYEYQVK